MKKINIFILAVAAVFSLSSCEDYLNVKPRGYDVASTISHYQGLLYGTEKFFLKESFPYMCFETYTDEAGYDMVYSQHGSYATSAYKWEADIYREDQLCGEWNSFTNILYSCNKVIAEVLNAQDGTQEQRLAVQSEARMLRAYCIFMMSRFFGDIPIIDKATTTNLDLPLRKESEVQEFVIKEMKEAVASLSEEETHCMRIFKGSGLALYGKILFMLGRYDEASEQFDAAFTELKKHSPNVKFIDYLPLVDENKDIKYPTTIEQDTESLYSFQGMPRLFEAIYGGMYGQLFFGVKNELIEKYFYDRADTRLAFYASVSTSKSAYNTYQKKQQYCANLSSNNISTNYAIGLSELYTMQAECLARKGDVAGAAALLTELRKNRLEPGHEAIPETIVTADQMTVFAFEERMREQLGFGSSWFDMKRLWNDPLFQDLKQYYVHPVGKTTYTLTEERLIMKIPPTVIAWHPEYEKK